MIIHFFIKFYDNLKNFLFYKNKYKYNLPFESNLIEQDIDFHSFKKDNSLINKIIFALNNLPHVVHKSLFNINGSVCNKYFFIKINFFNNILNINNNLDDIYKYFDDKLCRYIFIRIDLLNSFKNKMDHVNCIIIDKEKKKVIIFEPKAILIYNQTFIIEIIQKYYPLIIDYVVLLPQDLGYTFNNRLQKYDAFCQSYVIFIYILIILNEEVSYFDYAKMFNYVITYKNLGYFLFYLQHLLKLNNCDITNLPDKKIWSYPTSFKNILNIFNFIKKDTDLILYKENIKLVEIDDFTHISLF